MDPETPRPAWLLKSLTGDVASRRSSAKAVIVRAIGCSLPRSRLAARRKVSSPPVTSLISGRPDGERAGLVDHQRVDLLEPLERLGLAHQDAGGRAAADADHDRHRRCEAERARAGDDQHRDGGGDGVRPRGGGPHNAQAAAETTAASSTSGTNQPDTTSARRWIGARLRCASATSLTMPRQQGVGANSLGRHDETAAGIDRAGDHLGAALLGHRHRSPVMVDSSTVPSPSATHAIDRHLLARPHAQGVADGNGIDGDLLVASVAYPLSAMRGARPSRPLMAPDVASRARNSSTLAEQGEHDDDGGDSK
jgi:hypothetical protein